MYQIAADLVNRELRNATFEGKKHQTQTHRSHAWLSIKISGFYNAETSIGSPDSPLPQVGLYQEAIEAYEVVLGDGSVVRATKDNEYSDLYHCLPWSHGTLGQLELDLGPPYMTSALRGGGG